MNSFTPNLIPPRVLLLEEDANLRKCIVLTLASLEVEILEAPDVETALTILDAYIPDVFLVGVDPTAPESGAVIEAFRKKERRRPQFVLLMTMERPDDRWRQRYLPDQVLYKPIDLRFLSRRIGALLQQKETVSAG